MNGVTGVMPDATSEAAGDREPASLARCAGLVDAAMRVWVSEAGLPDGLREAIEYSVLSGGKRLRPTLAILAAEAVGGRAESSLASAGALELVHAFSLVHDDLPAMDDDDLRRGMPTAHVKFGEAMAILSGDAMLSLAFQALVERSGDKGLAGALTLELSKGTTAMIAGQVYDTLGGTPQGVDGGAKARLIHENKTGALIVASCRMGALSGMWPGVRERALLALDAYGRAVGLMFQIVDDLLDVEQTTEQLGKRAGKDRDAGKVTYPGTIGGAASRTEVERLRSEALEALETLGDRAGPLVEMCEYLARRTR